jgi:hypothetical protein
MSEITCPPIACDLTVFGDNEKKRQRAVLNELRAKVKGIRELPDGYALVLAHEPYMLPLVAEMIAIESRCCRFLVFGLEVKNGGSSITLSLTGGEGVKDFLREELSLEPGAVFA